MRDRARTHSFDDGGRKDSTPNDSFGTSGKTVIDFFVGGTANTSIYNNNLKIDGNGKILAAGLDVYAQEPHVPDALKHMENVVLLPHVASASVTTRDAMDQLVVDNLVNWFAGKPPLTPVPETPYERPV